MLSWELVCFALDAESSERLKFSRKIDCFPLIEETVCLVSNPEITHAASWEKIIYVFLFILFLIYPLFTFCALYALQSSPFHTTSQHTNTPTHTH